MFPSIRHAGAAMWAVGGWRKGSCGSNGCITVRMNPFLRPGNSSRNGPKGDGSVRRGSAARFVMAGARRSVTSVVPFLKRSGQPPLKRVRSAWPVISGTGRINGASICRRITSGCARPSTGLDRRIRCRLFWLFSCISPRILRDARSGSCNLRSSWQEIASSRIPPTR